MRNSLASCCVTACQVASDTPPASTVISAALAVPFSSTIARAYRRSCTPRVFRGSSVGVTSTFAAPARSVGDAFPLAQSTAGTGSPPRPAPPSESPGVPSSRISCAHVGAIRQRVGRWLRTCHVELALDARGRPTTAAIAVLSGHEARTGCTERRAAPPEAARANERAGTTLRDVPVKNQVQLIAYVDRLPGGRFATSSGFCLAGWRGCSVAPTCCPSSPDRRRRRRLRPERSHAGRCAPRHLGRRQGAG